MSFVIVESDVMRTAVADMAGVGSALSAAYAASAAQTTAIAAAAGDEVSAAIALLFSSHGQRFQALSAQAAAFHRQFVQAMTVSAGSYAGAELANASPLQTLDQEVLGWLNAPTQELFGRPLFGNGSNGHIETAAGTARGNGGESGLFGTGGTGRGGRSQDVTAAIGAAREVVNGGNTGTGGAGGRHGGTGHGGTNAVTLGSGTATAGSSGGAGTNASALHTLDVSPTAASDTGGIALVMGPTGIPQPNAAYVATVDRLYLQPLGFHGHAESLYTPELGYNTDANLPTDVADLMTAINAQIATGQVSAQNPIWVFGYSQSSAAASEAMVQLHAEGVPSSDLHFVLVGDPASASGGILNTLLPSLGPLGDLIKPLLPWFDLNQTMGLTTPNYYPTDVYTLAGDGYAAWPQNFFTNPIADINAISGFFSTHEEYLGLTPGQIQGATPTYTDGLVQYYTIDNNSSQLLPTLINAAVNVDWISPATGELLDSLF
jgi:PE family/PE-PPE domain